MLMMNGVIWTVSLGENTVKRGIQKWCWPLRSIRNWKPIKAILDSAEMRIKMKQSKSIGSIVDDHIFILCFNIVGHTLDRLCQFKGSSYQSHFIFKMNLGKVRIRHKTTLKLNDEFLHRLKIDWRWRHSNSDSIHVGSDSFRHWSQK